MRILLAIDDSPYSATAVEEVKTRPWPVETTVRVLSAVQIPMIATESWVHVTVDLENMRQEMTRHYEEVTARAADALRASGLTVEAVVRQGDPRSVIVDEAK